MSPLPHPFRAQLCAVIFSLLSLPGMAQEAAPPAPFPDNQELATIFTEDQADRQPKNGQMTDHKWIEARDHERRSRVMALYQADALKTGADYIHAAMIMQHGGTPEAYLLAHEFCLAALVLGHDHAAWLAAASHDRFLMSIGRAQRFGTQYARKQPGGPLEVAEVEEGVRDSLRQHLGLQSLEMASESAANVTQQMSQPDKPMLSLGRFPEGNPPGLDVLDLKAGDLAPEIISHTAPHYPATLQAERPSGFAIVLAIIGSDGTASQLKVAQTTHPDFGKAAEAAVADWKFKPGTKGGSPARVLVVIQITFRPPSLPATTN